MIPCFGEHWSTSMNPSQVHEIQLASNGSELSRKRAHYDNAEDLRSQRRSLPIFFGRRALVEEVMANSSVIIISETGSGKTTQLPQYLLEAGLTHCGAIACTQPRRVAAITIAQRVAQERQVELGTLVGYCVRFEDVTSDKTKIKYMTDGMLLREALLDSMLLRYCIIILDEAHERTIHTDVLFGVVKAAQERRIVKNRPLKIVIMSATLQVEEYASFFGNAKVCYIEGRRHPVKTMYTDTVQTDYIHASLISALQIHQEMPLGHDILVFLTGQEEIEALARLIKECIQHLDSDLKNVLICPLFAALPNSQQMRVFTQTPAGFRKIILATNIAETSLTIPGVKYVIDTGMVKLKEYNPTTGLEVLKVRPIAKSQARQRHGRAGRECPGICYRLYTEESFHQLKDDAVPEIQRCNLKGVVLQLLALGVADVKKFDFMSPPSCDALEDALKQLTLLKAITSPSEQKLTDLGRAMAEFPLDPSLARCIIASQELNCTEEIITIVALLSAESIVYVPSEKREDARKALFKFQSSEGDHVTLLNLFRAYRHSKGNIEWCREHFINIRAMKNVVQIRSQLRDMCERAQMKLCSCGKDLTAVRKSLTAGLFTNSAERQRDGSYLTVGSRETVTIHPSSTLFKAKPSFVVYNELVYTSKCFIRHVSVVDPAWLVDACPDYFRNCRFIPEAIHT